MIIVSGTLEIEPEGRDAAVAAAAEMIRATRLEDGCLEYGFYADLVNPNLFRIYEEWQDLPSLQNHFETPHMKTFREQLSRVKIVSRQVKRHEVSSSADL